MVDYGSSDGLSQWVWRHFESDIQQGRLRFFEVKNEVRWNVSKAKNLAHRLARGDYLFNLDADNFVTDKDIESILQAQEHAAPSHQWTGEIAP